MNFTRQFLLCPFLISLVWGCHSNPYPPTEELTKDRPPLPRRIEPAFSIVVNEFMEFNEGIPNSYPVTFHVPDGKPVVKIENRPEENFRYDEVEGKIIWTPSFHSGNNPDNPLDPDREYNVVIKLSDSPDSVEFRKKTVRVKVHDQPRDFTIEGESDLTIKEGVPFTYAFKIVNEDFPDARHDVRFSDLFMDRMIGTSLMPVDETRPLEFTIQKTFPLNLLKVMEDGELFFSFQDMPMSWRYFNCKPSGCSIRYSVSIEVEAPNGHRASKQINVVIEEDRRPPDVSLPESMTIQENGTHFLVVQDPNREIAPLLKLEARPYIKDYPRRGVNFTLQEENFQFTEHEGPEGTYFKTVFLSLQNIPSHFIGKKLGMKLRICNRDGNGKIRMTDFFDRPLPNCRDLEVLADIVAPVFALPHFADYAWPEDRPYYVKVGQMSIIDLPIYEKKGSSEMIGIYEMDFPGPTQDGEVVWNDRTGKVLVRARTPGDKSFFITATNSFGEKDSAFFQVKALPEDWGPVVFATKTPNGKEARAYRDLLNLSNSDYVDLFLYDDVQSFDLQERMLALRETLFISSDVFAGKNLSDVFPGLDVIDHYKDQFKNLVVATPLMDRLSPALRAEMDKHNVFNKRYDDDSPTGPLNTLVFETAGNFSLRKPEKNVTLGGTFGPESNNPVIFVLGTSDCDILLQLRHKTDLTMRRRPAAVRCPRKEGGHLILIGFEFPDLRVEVGETPNLAQIWLGQMIGM